MNELSLDKINELIINNIGFLKNISQITDIIIILIVVYGAVSGYKKGLIGTVIRCLKSAASILGAVIASRVIAPIAAPKIAEFIIDKIFENKIGEAVEFAPQIAEQIHNNILLQAVNPIAQSIAFSAAFFASMFIINFTLSLFIKVMRILARMPVISKLNRICGLLLGAAVSVILCMAVLYLLRKFAPEIFGANGFLSPQNVAKTSITAYLLGLLSRV